MDHQNSTTGSGSGDGPLRTPTPSPGYADSGYASQLSPFLGLKRQKRIFVKEIPASARIRLDDWRVLFGGKLYQHVIKDTKSPPNIAIKPRYIGTTEDDSKLCALFVCNKEAVKSVKAFLRPSHVREPLEVEFRIQIIGGLNLARQDTVDVHLDLCSPYVNPTASLCGLPIVANIDDHSSSGTLGGVLMVTTSCKMLYGMTAGHMVNIPTNFQARDLLDTRDSAGVVCDDPSVIDFNSDNGSDDEDQDDHDDDMILSPEDFADIRIDEDPPFVTLPSTRIGAIATHIEKSQPQTRNHDWDLIELPCEKYLPNVIQNSAKVANELDLVGPRTIKLSSPQDVVVISSRSGRPKGVLRQADSSLIIGPGKNFVDTLDLTLHDHRKLRPGDSGSWVINHQTGEVYGHVVAIDIFGDSYVMPMQATLDDIKVHLGVLDVSLPSREDVISWVADHQAPDLPDEKGRNRKPAQFDHQLKRVEYGSSRDQTWRRGVTLNSDNSLMSTSETHLPTPMPSRNSSSHVPGLDVENDDPGGKRKTTSADSHLLACPFFRFDPARYEECLTYRLSSFSSVRQHLERHHALGDNYCPRCMQSWKDGGKEYQAHLYECSRVQEVSDDRLSPQELMELREISSRTRGLTDEQRWMLMWNMLFSENPEPVSPFRDSYMAEVTNICRDRNKGELRKYFENIVDMIQGMPKPLSPSMFNNICAGAEHVVYRVPSPQVQRRRKLDVWTADQTLAHPDSPPQPLQSTGSGLVATRKRKASASPDAN